MIKKPFFSFGNPKLKYPVVQSLLTETDKEIPVPETVTVHLKRAFSPIDEDILKKGDVVKTGQRISIDNEDNVYFISPVTGTISNITEYIGYLSISYTSISIKTDSEEKPDEEFKTIKGTASPENAAKYLQDLPGCPDFKSFLNRKTLLESIIIEGIDDDLLVTTNQILLSARIEDIKEGAELLREITGVEKVIIVTTPELAGKAGGTGVEVYEVDPVYPDALPKMIMKKVLGRVVPAGKSCEDLGVGFIKAEAVVALAEAFNQGNPPIQKVVTVIDKDGVSKNINARIGTPVKKVFEEFGINIEHGDRIIMGGPMRGRSIYSEDSPILADTDAIMVQDRSIIQLSADTPCVNCGECVRVCPARIPVNMLVRLLENSLYEEAAEEYDMLSCIECGLCAYVCVAKIPIVHYIMLGKHELDKLKSMEESNA
jgi:electron transport complex protein RnfC